MPYEHAYYCAPATKADLSNRPAAVALRDFEPLMTAVGHERPSQPGRGSDACPLYPNSDHVTALEQFAASVESRTGAAAWVDAVDRRPKPTASKHEILVLEAEHDAAPAASDMLVLVRDVLPARHANNGPLHRSK